MDKTEEFVNHLRHVIQEEMNVQLTDKAVNDIKKTLLGFARVCTRGSVANVKEMRRQLMEAKKR